MIECRKSGVQYARIGVDSHQDHVLDAENFEQGLQISAMETIKPFLVVDDVIGLLQEFGKIP